MKFVHYFFIRSVYIHHHTQHTNSRNRKWGVNEPYGIKEGNKVWTRIMQLVRDGELRGLGSQKEGHLQGTSCPLSVSSVDHSQQPSGKWGTGILLFLRGPALWLVLYEPGVHTAPKWISAGVSGQGSEGTEGQL